MPHVSPHAMIQSTIISLYSAAWYLLSLGVQVLTDAGLNPHKPVRPMERGDARRLAVRKIVRPPVVKATLPFGPAPPMPEYSDIHERMPDPLLIDAAMNEWYTKAREEFSAISLRTPGSSGPHRCRSAASHGSAHRSCRTLGGCLQDGLTLFATLAGERWLISSSASKLGACWTRLQKLTTGSASRSERMRRR